MTVTVNLDSLQEKAALGTIEMLNDVALDFAAALAEELPPGVSAKSITIKPTNSAGNNFSVSVGFVDEGVLKYLWGYWKGLPQKIDIYGNMRFTRWFQGPSDLRSRDGYFHFKHVVHEYLPHDFIEKAIDKFQVISERAVKKFTDRVGK